MENVKFKTLFTDRIQTEQFRILITIKN